MRLKHNVVSLLYRSSVFPRRNATINSHGVCWKDYRLIVNITFDLDVSVSELHLDTNERKSSKSSIILISSGKVLNQWDRTIFSLSIFPSSPVHPSSLSLSLSLRVCAYRMNIPLKFILKLWVLFFCFWIFMQKP